MTNNPRFLSAVFALVLFVSATYSFTCDQTLSVSTSISANVVAALNSVPPNGVVCLNDGTYGQIDIFDVDRSTYATLTSKNPYGATAYINLGKSSFIKFSNLTLSGTTHAYCASNIQWLYNHVINYIMAIAPQQCTGSLNVLVEGNNFGPIDKQPDGLEGRLTIAYAQGVTVRYNTFGPGGASDGINICSGATDVVVGPGNIFTGILEALCNGVHCDAIQLYGAGTGVTITNNLFENGDTFILAADGSDGVVVTNNVFNSSFWYQKIQMGAANRPTFLHNTFIGFYLSFGNKAGNPQTNNVLLKDNIFAAGSIIYTGYGDGCAQCTFDHNMFDTVADSAGATNSLIGTPVWVGGPHARNFNDFALTSSSPGHAAASDGTDMGINLVPSISTPTTRPTTTPTPKPSTTPTPRPTTPTPTPRPTTTPTPKPTSTPTPRPTTPKPIESLYAPYALVPATIADSSSVNVGVQFSVNTTGRVLGCAVFSHSGGCGANPNSCDLWNSAGAQLAHTVFPCNAAGAGWLFINFTTPVAISANTQYTVSSLFPTGSYSGANNKFTAPRTVGHITVPVNGGVYAYSSMPTSPTQTYLASEYFVTPLFSAL